MVGPGKTGTLSELKEGSETVSKFGAVLSTSEYTAKWIKHGAECRQDFIICAEVAFEMPVFH